MGFAVTSFLGTILHFLYEWLGESTLIALFSGVNESTWEHMKLLFWPMLIYAFFQGLFFMEREDFWCIKLRGILLGLTLIPVLFYTYNGAVGKSPDWVNIAIFFISAGIAYTYEALKLYKDIDKRTNPRAAIVVLYTVAALFVIFTFRTPRLGLFRDPLTGRYGI